jgi:hypothetical protein
VCDCAAQSKVLEGISVGLCWAVLGREWASCRHCGGNELTSHHRWAGASRSPCTAMTHTYLRPHLSEKRDTEHRPRPRPPWCARSSPSQMPPRCTNSTLTSSNSCRRASRRPLSSLRSRPRHPRLHRPAQGGLAAGLVQQPAGAPHPRDPAPHRRGRHRPQPRRSFAFDRRRASRAERRMGRVGPLRHRPRGDRQDPFPSAASEQFLEVAMIAAYRQTATMTLRSSSYTT